MVTSGNACIRVCVCVCACVCVCETPKSAMMVHDLTGDYAQPCENHGQHIWLLTGHVPHGTKGQQSY